MRNQSHNSRRWSFRVLGRYALIQIPGFVLLVLLLILVRDWFNVPFWVVGMIIGLWLAKDVLLYPLVWRAYDPDNGGTQDRVIGARGIARERLAPFGYVRVGGELWKAEVIHSARPVEEGEGVKVLGIRSLTLIVEPDLEQNVMHDRDEEGVN